MENTGSTQSYSWLSEDNPKIISHHPKNSDFSTFLLLSAISSGFLPTTIKKKKQEKRRKKSLAQSIGNGT
jgi:hypothetical protein